MNIITYFMKDDIDVCDCQKYFLTQFNLGKIEFLSLAHEEM